MQMRRRRRSAGHRVWVGHRFTAARAAVGGATLVASLLMAIGSAHASGLSEVPVSSLSQVSVSSLAAPPATTPAQGAARAPAPADKPVPVAKARPAANVFRGGQQYVISDKELCSTGFAVTGSTGQDGFVSAGHCGAPGDAVETQNGTPMGAFAASSFPGTDYAWVATTTQFAGSPTVSRHNGTVAAVHGGAPAPVGAAVCMSGQASGWHCGTITATNQTVEYDQGLVYGLTATTVCTDSGDSGGAFISGDQAQGVTSGGVGDCASHGVTYFQPVVPILKAYGLTLRTS